ncbi:alpha/beta fold hydrolase [Kribbella sp. CA-247076]|uniref:alpha/beta fold hydrolase n=1 Tax=Kribbella sp. CA-247076 TaxID=3239941 RepID=UPI003D927213
MQKTVSADGTVIAYDRLGSGPALVLVTGLLCDRAKMAPTAEELAKHYTVLNYDRRGRGGSGDTAPYAIQREIDDLAAVLGEAGAGAAVYAHSSGAGLALHAAARGLPVSRVVLHEAPYTAGLEDEREEARRIGTELRDLLGAGRYGDAVEMMLIATGMPAELVEESRTAPWWAALEAMAPTMSYDSEVMGDLDGGGVPLEMVASVTVPALVLCGGASPDWMLSVARQLSDALPAGTLQVLDHQEHVVPPEILAPVLVEYLGRDFGRA